jgi:hypothetical protein
MKKIQDLDQKTGRSHLPLFITVFIDAYVQQDTRGLSLRALAIGITNAEVFISIFSLKKY